MTNCRAMAVTTSYLALLARIRFSAARATTRSTVVAITTRSMEELATTPSLAVLMPALQSAVREPTTSRTIVKGAGATSTQTKQFVYDTANDTLYFQPGAPGDAMQELAIFSNGYDLKITDFSLV
jgi:hypothetical protein